MEIINGYQCRDCTDAALAAKHIDPQHPKDGPYGVNAEKSADARPANDPAVVFGGALAKFNDLQARNPAAPRPVDTSVGARLNLTA